jgi:hypothetical protein
MVLIDTSSFSANTLAFTGFFAARKTWIMLNSLFIE